ncbi:MAG: hypothetical protein IKE60_22355 [Reyranella sp.]|uniref:bestrophin-like domain n=1 Tax=Reyranella sp. TaxID=1929291 RepID=UPI0025E95774|nr:hypothetical protein [Reyranella sp.]MBR2817419.1 hypothetical protein [Reyranella sp.]
MSLAASISDIAVSALLPVASAALIFLAEAKGPLSGPIRKTRGIVAPYFGSVAILFGLFAALLASDVWQKTNEAKRAVLAEAHAVETLGYFARANGLEELIFPRLKAYAKAASAEDPYSSAIGPARNETDKAALDILTTVSQAYGIDGSARSAMLTTARELLRAHDDRLSLANDVTAPIKWVAIVVLGALTQIALLLVHVDNQRAMRAAIGLFTLAFSFCLVVVTIFDTPFETILRNEPAASLDFTLGSLSL